LIWGVVEVNDNPKFSSEKLFIGFVQSLITSSNMEDNKV